MTEWFFDLSEFHFIQNWPLILVPAVGYFWWRIRGLATKGRRLPESIAPHLASALTVGAAGERKFYPVDGTALVLILTLVGAAGPTWSRVPNPLVADTVALVVVLKASRSMERTDVAPNRLERGKHKILDLVDRRAGARTALIAYSGSAHRVVPLTEDPAVIKPFLEGISPAVMPSDGQNASRALEMAERILAESEAPGAILFVLDTLDRVDVPAFRKLADEDGPGVVFLATIAPAAEAEVLKNTPGVSVVAVTADDGDIVEIERRLQSAYRQALSRDDRQKWDDRGWMLAWPAAFLMLFWFRRGWTMRWGIVVLGTMLFQAQDEANAEGWLDWFLTADQQGQLALENKDYTGAAERFVDPMRKGYALYRNGSYKEAAEVFASLPSSEAAFAEGVSLIKGRSYRDGIAAFEKALERDPENEAATHNLELSRHILDYIEKAREESDTGEESGIGADDVVYDNEAARGTDTATDHSDKDVAPESAEQWMRTVDTKTSDFLKSRFFLEAARTSQ